MPHTLSAALPLLSATLCLAGASAAPLPDAAEHTNSLGMRLARIEPGSFRMGSSGAPLPAGVTDKEHLRFGDPDEQPRHEVTINEAFHMAATEITNAQYEAFDPDHRALRGRLGFSTADDEAAVYVSWNDAVRFCEWLSEREGLPYRLPTEAEWEYACRAGTDSPYWTGDTLPEEFFRNQVRTWYPDPERSDPAKDVVPLTVGVTPANPWGLCDMHGNVEEWCLDWHGPYAGEDVTDPTGPTTGEFRVTRGGSHGTEPYYLRSANRSGALPDERSWYIGFRVVLAEMPAPNPSAPAETPVCARDVSPVVPADLTSGPDPDEPHFAAPTRYVHIPDTAFGPLFAHHNHVPSIVECPNGDLLVAWYSCMEEPGREVALAASRLRYGTTEWEPASLFWDAPDRTETSVAFHRDGDRILCFIGVSAASTWGSTETVLRISEDNGATWTPARIINPNHGQRNMPVESILRLSDGTLLLPCDAVSTGDGGTAIHLSTDNGETWSDPGGKTAGIHAGIVELADGRLMAHGRGDSMDGRMPRSLSSDRGVTWTYSATEFPPIGGGQRLVLLRLREGPILFASFGKVEVTDADGRTREVTGLYAALSYDDGETWPVRRLVSDDAPDHELETTDGRPFIMSASTAEPRGYLSVHQAENGLIHLVSSRLHYTFNQAWLLNRTGPRQ